MFIDRTYFNFGVASLPDSDVVNNILSNQSFIDRCEKDILMKLLGRTLYNDLIINKDTTDASNRLYILLHLCLPFFCYLITIFSVINSQFQVTNFDCINYVGAYICLALAPVHQVALCVA